MRLPPYNPEDPAGMAAVELRVAENFIRNVERLRAQAFLIYGPKGKTALTKLNQQLVVAERGVNDSFKTAGYPWRLTLERVCTHCKRRSAQHVGDKCLFGATRYQQHDNYVFPQNGGFHCLIFIDTHAEKCDAIPIRIRP